MMISKSQVTQVLQAYSERTAPAVQDANDTSKGFVRTGGGDRVDLSMNPKKMRLYARVVSGTPEVRAERVKEIARKISSGEYNVGAKEIACKILSRAIVDELV